MIGKTGEGIMNFDLEIYTYSNNICVFSNFRKLGDSYEEVRSIYEYNSIPDFDIFEMTKEEFKKRAMDRIMRFLKENSVLNTSELDIFHEEVNNFPGNDRTYIEFGEDYLYIKLRDKEIISGTGDLETIVYALIKEEYLAIEIPEEYGE